MMLFDGNEVRRALSVLVQPGDVFEIRVLDGKDRPDGRGFQWTGWFDDPDRVVAELRQFRGWQGCYFTLNPVDPLLMHRSANRLQAGKRGAATEDANIMRRVLLPLDFDPLHWGTDATSGPIRGIASTDAERLLAHERANVVTAALVAYGFPPPVEADSGNGAHRLWHVDLPPLSDLPERFLRGVARLYGDQAGSPGHWNRAAAVEVDTTVYNPARIWKLYGTLACKGSNHGDRPWRMSHLQVMPPREFLGEPMLRSWCDEFSPATPVSPAKHHGVPPASTAATPVATPATGTVTTVPFDALGLVRSAGLVPGPGRTRADGATFHELERCPCDRGESGAFVSLSATGAVGLGCMHQSCAWSTAAGTPGEHWVQWRTQHDPSYGHTLHPPSSPAARREAVAGYTSTLPPVASEPPPPPRRPDPVTRGADGRTRIDVALDLKEVRDAVVSALVIHPAVYLTQGRLSRPADGRMDELDAGSLDSVAVNACEFVRWQRDKSTGEFVARPDVLPLRVRGMLERPDPEIQTRFRRVDQVTRSPFFTRHGEAMISSGYSWDARTLLVDAPELDPHPEPDGACCLAYVRNLVADFPFEGGLTGAECANFLGALLVPLVRPMIDGPVPLCLIEANRPGTGKTLLAQLVQVVHGLPAEVGTLPHDEHAVAALILSILRESKAIHVFDNVKHQVVSSSLDIVLTGRSYTDRILGVTHSPSFSVRQLWIMTSNNAKFSDDMSRRMFRVRLKYDGKTPPEQRTDIGIRDLLRHVETNRVAILSRLVQVVREWVDAGMPVTPDAPIMGSFESFSTIVGSILHLAGEHRFLANTSVAREEVRLDDDWGPFLHAWHLASSSQGPLCGPQSPHKLWRFCKDNDKMTHLLGQGRNDYDQQTRLRTELRARRDQILYGLRIVGSKDERTANWLYSLEEVH